MKYLRIAFAVLALGNLASCIIDTSGLWGHHEDGGIDASIDHIFDAYDSVDRGNPDLIDTASDNADRLTDNTQDSFDRLPDRYPDGCVPNPPEACNGRDDDCDGDTDEDLGATTCGVGACRRVVDNCEGGSPQTCVPGEPAPEEDCLTSDDDNCNGTTNEMDALNCVNFYYDNDGDGYGIGEPQCWCIPIAFMRAIRGDDCNDRNNRVHPGVTEMCNGFDDDCDGTTDVGCPDGGRD